MKPRRYLFAVVDGGGNVPPELGAARRLVERGHSVTVLAEDSVAGDVRATGAVWRRWIHPPNRPDRRPEHDPARDWECKYPWQLVDRLMTTMLLGPAPAYAQDVLEAVGETVPDLVVCSMFCIGGMVAAEAADIPFDVTLPNVYPFPADGLPPFGMGLRQARGPVGRFRDRVFNALADHLWDANGLAGLNALRRRYDLPPLSRFFDQVGRARRQLVLTSAAFDFPARLPANARYVGPVLDDPAWASSAWTTPAGSSPLILVALSSTFQDQIGCLQRIVDALSTMPVRAIVTTGPAVEVTALRPSPNVVIVESAPHRQVLQQAALAITHGGHGTVMKALAAGVPLVVMPHGRDQGDTAARVSARGAGATLTRTAGVRAISRAVLHVLRHDSYRSAAQQLGGAIQRDADAHVLIRELESLPNRDTRTTDGTPHLDRGRNLEYRVSLLALAILLGLGSHAFALGKHKAAYVAGTLTQFNATDIKATNRPIDSLRYPGGNALGFSVPDRSATMDLDLSVKRIAEAARTIDPTFLNTPQYADEQLNAALARNVVVKVETANPVRSFKGRGADFFMGRVNPGLSVVCSSTGNFGQAMAYAGRRRRVAVEVFVPENVNPVKLARMRALGARVMPIGADSAASEAAARDYVARKQGCVYVEDGKETAIAEGAGTIGAELIQAGPFDAVVLPVGDGALIAGVACWIKDCAPQTRIIGVCASGAPCMALSWRAGKPISTARSDTIAEGIEVRVPVTESVVRLVALVDDMVLVDDSDLLEAVQLSARTLGLLLEPSAAAGLAAIRVHDLPGDRLATVLTGSNLRPEHLRALST